MPEENPCDPPATTGCDPASQLGKLKETLQTTQLTLEQTTKKRDELQERITLLEKANGEIGKVVEEYQKSAPGFQAEKGKQDEYATLKWQIALCAVGQKKDEIDDAIAAYGKELAAAQAELQTLEQQQAAAQQAYQQAQQTLTTKQQALEEGKATKAHIEAGFKKANELKTALEAEEKLSHPAGLYFLTQELQHLLQGLTVLTPGALLEKLNDAWCEVNDARAAWQEAGAVLRAAQAKYTAQQKKVEDLQKNRRQKILERLAPWNTVQAAETQARQR